MGEKALFIEHTTNASNRNFKREYGDNLHKFAPWTDLQKTPYTITGPYLKVLFEQAFIKGLHNPMERPPAQAWEQALIKTNDLKLNVVIPLVSKSGSSSIILIILVVLFAEQNTITLFLF